MSFITIEDFRSGVDRRRPIFAGVPGSLWEGINGHLTRGGDFEKAKAFVAKHALPAGTFGFAATATDIYVFGSVVNPGVPAGVIYQRLQHPDGGAMTDVPAVELFDGKLYVAAEYDNGDVIHFYDGVMVDDWVSGIVRTGMANTTGIATHLTSLMQSDADYITTSAGPVITITAATAGTPFTLSTKAENGGSVDDQTATVALVTANVPVVAETLAVVSFAVTAGTNSAGVNKVSSIKINGVEVLNVAVDWVTSNSTTATNIATQINTYASVPDYTATASGQTVTISADVGSGASPNGHTVAIDPDGDVAIDGAAAAAIVNKTMAGGVDAIPGQAQVQTVTIGGTFEVNDRFTIIIDGKHYGADGNPRTKGTTLLTHKNKMWSGASSIVNFSGVVLPAGWNSLEDAGAGFINAATNSAGSSDVTGLGIYQSSLAILSKRTIQVWSVDEDETLNRISQTLRNTGTMASRSVLAFSDSDLFYLDNYGVRSLRARDSSNSAMVAGVGALIDTYIVQYMRTLTEAQKEAACAVIDPEDGRFLLALGTKVFVFSYFPETKISGWTWYEPGFQITGFAIKDNRLYARSGNTIYLYGGDDNATYDNATPLTVTCWIPFLAMGNAKDGIYKTIQGADIAATNTWDMILLVDPNDENRYTTVGEMPGFTYNIDEAPAVAHVTHVSPKLTCDRAGAAVLSKITLYFEPGETSGRG